VAWLRQQIGAKNPLGACFLSVRMYNKLLGVVRAGTIAPSIAAAAGF
jgi:hypothetical protein